MTTTYICPICTGIVDEEDPDPEGAAVQVVDPATSRAVIAHQLCAGDGVDSTGRIWPPAPLNLYRPGDLVTNHEGLFGRYARCAVCDGLLDYDGLDAGDESPAQFAKPTGQFTVDIVDAHGLCGAGQGWELA